MAVREVNSSGTTSGAITVNKTDIGTADAAYTTGNLAYLASSADDHIVLTEDMAIGFTGVGYTFGTGVRVSVADNVRAAGDQYVEGSGGRITNAYAFNCTHTSGTLIFEGFLRHATSGNTAWLVNGSGGTTYISHGIGGTNSIYAHVALNGSLGSGKCVIDHYRCEQRDGTSGNSALAWNFSGGDKNLEVYNCMNIISNDTTTHTAAIRGQSGSQRVVVADTASTEASGATAPTSAHFSNCVAPDSIPAGHNASDDGTAPGTDTDTLADASDITNTVDNDNVYFTQTRDQQDTYNGADTSGLIYSEASTLDWDLQVRTDWGIGTDWEPSLPSGGGQPTGTRMRARMAA